jgi:hypothetical protein
VAWHWLLHTVAGLGIGLTLGAVVSLLLRRPVPGLLAALAGQAVSVAPDLLFVVGRVPHARWMDVFLGHITLHLTFSPIGVSLAVFLLGGWAWWAAGEGGRRRMAAALVVAAVVVYVGALVTARPVPQRLADFGPGAGALDLLAGEDPADWRCGPPG